MDIVQKTLLVLTCKFPKVSEPVLQAASLAVPSWKQQPDTGLKHPGVEFQRAALLLIRQRVQPGLKVSCKEEKPLAICGSLCAGLPVEAEPLVSQLGGSCVIWLS